MVWRQGAEAEAEAVVVVCGVRQVSGGWKWLLQRPWDTSLPCRDGNGRGLVDVFHRLFLFREKDMRRDKARLFDIQSPLLAATSPVASAGLLSPRAALGLHGVPFQQLVTI